MKSGDVVNGRVTLHLLSIESHDTLAQVEAEVRAKDLTGALEPPEQRSDPKYSTYPALMGGDLVNNDEETPKSMGSWVVFNQDANVSTVYRLPPSYPCLLMMRLGDPGASHQVSSLSHQKTLLLPHTGSQHI